MEQNLKFDLPNQESSYIKVIGVGGSGNNAVNHMYAKGIHGVDFIVCNTDAKDLNASPIPNKLQLGTGLGAGNEPEAARKAAEDKVDEIRSVFDRNTKMVFITAGMGGGTGTGAAPVVARVIKEIELDDPEVPRILTIGVVTTPFTMEGNRRVRQAQQGIAELRKHVDAILIINNDKLNEYGDMTLTQAFGLANDILATATKGISEIITVNSMVHIDFRDVNTVMRDSGVALMGCGVAEGEERAKQAVRQAVNSPLLNDSNIRGAKNVLLYVASASEKEMRMNEFEEITRFVRAETGSEVDIIWGSGIDDNLGEKLSITLVATGFSEGDLFNEKEMPVISLEASSSHTLTNIAGVAQTHTQIPLPQRDEAPMRIEAPIRIDLDQEMPQAVNHAPVAPQTAIHDDNSEESMLQEIPEDYLDIRIVNTRPETQAISPSPNARPASRSLLDNGLDHYERKTMTLNQIAVTNPQERVSRMKEMSIVKDSKSLESLEKEPAFLRRKIELSAMPHSSQDEVAKLALSDDGRVVQNSFFNHNVD